MITCPKCNKELSDGTKFCDGCGAQIFETIFALIAVSRSSGRVCFLARVAELLLLKLPAEEQPAAVPTEKKKLPKKAIMFGGIGVAVVAVLILVISLFSGGGKAKRFYPLSER